MTLDPMHAPAPVPTVVDGIHPWWDLYVPATFGDAARVRAAVPRAIREAPAEARGTMHAVAARSFLVLGQDSRARRHVVAAAALGGEEADALLTFARPDGLARVRARIRFATSAGAAADAACDGAALSLQAGDVRGVQAHVLRALAACPHHGEAGRWARVLRDLSEGQRVSVLDRHSLMPLAGNGWLSPERYRRRVLSELGYTASPPPGSSLSQLQDAGVLEHYFALPEEHATLPVDHPLTLLELHADRVRALTHEAREASGEGWRLWERARMTDDTAAEDAALLLTALATTAPGLADLGWSVADWALRQRCRDAATWRAYRARHAARARRRNAREDALAVLEDAGASATAFQLAVEALAAVGELAVAQAAARRHAHRSELTRELEALERGAPLPARCVVTPRLLPRGEAAAH